MQHTTTTLIVRSADAIGDQRTLRGIASSPTIDRMGDIVDPLGATFAAKVPLLDGHNAGSPVGWATLTATKAGIAFVATITKIATPGPLQQRLDDMWAAVKAGLYQSVSIGFRALGNDVDRLPGGGLRFNKTEILELSLVSVPAQPDAQIVEVRSLGKTRAGTGRGHVAKIRPKTTKTDHVVKLRAAPVIVDHVVKLGAR